MKKIVYVLLSIIIIGVSACQKENTTPGKKIDSNLKSISPTLKIRRDTVPPDPAKITARRDTVPPDPAK